MSWKSTFENEVFFATLSGVWRARPIRDPDMGLTDNVLYRVK